MHNLNKEITTDYSNNSLAFQRKQLDVHEFRLNLENSGMQEETKDIKPEPDTQVDTFSQQDKYLRELLRMTELRTLTWIEEIGNKCGQHGEDKLKRHGKV